jgi:phospholipase/lecithinase/hemolysin
MMASAVTLNKVVVFGDSLSDNGNLYEYMKHQLPMSPPYYKGRFTNGPVWAELLVDSFFPQGGASHLLDYAFAGAAVVNDDDETLFTLRNELSSYFLSHQGKADEDNLYVIWIGANNYLAIPDELEQTVQDVNDGIKSAILQLAEKGAKYILVVNLPDLGRTPVARDYEVVPTLTQLSTLHNAMLKENVDALGKTNPSLQLIYFDVKTALDEMLTTPAQYGFTNVTDTCYESNTDEELSSQPGLMIAAHIKTLGQPVNCAGYLFFDPVHPSALAHQIMAERTHQLLINAGIELE